MKTLTPRQQEILDYIRLCISDQGMPPTRADIARELGFKSPNAAEDHLKALARKGAIELLSGTSRGIRLVANDVEPAEVAFSDLDLEGLPLVGQVAAGSPILAIENVERQVPVSRHLFQPSADYLLRVRGDSMIDAGIYDGDLLAVQRTTQVKEGDILVVRIEDEVTVKRWHRVDDNLVELVAENQAYAPIQLVAGAQDSHIEGKAVGIIRQWGL